jgi:hypothetical protein
MYLKNVLVKTSALTLFVALASCSGTDGAAPGEDTFAFEGLTLSGSLSQDSLLRLQSRSSGVVISSVDLDSLKVACVTLGLPLRSGEADVASNGKFAVEIPNAAGATITCSLISGSGDDAEAVASLVIEDTEETDLSGNTKKDTGVALKDDADLGDIELDLASGTATANKAAIADQVAEVSDAELASVAWDMTGEWTFANIEGSLPKGYSPLCEGEEEEGDDGCRGPAAGMTVYLKRVAGVKTDTETPAFGMMIWNNEEEGSGKAEFAACGGKLGTDFESLASQGVDFSTAACEDAADAPNSSCINEGNFDFTTTGDDYDFGGGLQEWNVVDGWKFDVAVSQFGQNTCGNVSLGNGRSGWSCKDSQSNGVRVDSSGGCSYTVAGGQATNFQLRDWSLFHFNPGEEGATPPCQLTVASNVYTNTCTVQDAMIDHDNDGETATIEADVNCFNSFYYAADGAEETPLAATAIEALHTASSVYDDAPEWEYDGDTGFTENTGGCSGMSTANGTLDWCEENKFFNWQNVEMLVGQGDECFGISTATPAGELAQLRCYAEFYYQTGRYALASVPNACVSKVRTNFMASVPEDFVTSDVKPEAQVGANFVEYDASGTVTFMNEERSAEGVQVGNTYIECRTREQFALSLTPKTKDGETVTVAVGEFAQQTTLLDIQKPACVADFVSKGATATTVGSTTLYSTKFRTLFEMSVATATKAVVR